MSSTPSKIEALVTAADLPERLAAALAANSEVIRQETRRFAPELSYGRHFGPAPATARRAAVIALLFPHHGRWHLPLTLRPALLTKHGGQISLPGGAAELDESTADAALRELSEELGAVESVELLQQLSDSYVYVSDFLVSPWLAATHVEPRWQPQAGEVERIVELPLESLLDPASVGTVRIERGPRSFSAPCLWFGDDYIWGATSIILGELAGALRNILNPQL